jgi:hypothetical protein
LYEIYIEETLLTTFSGSYMFVMKSTFFLSNIILFTYILSEIIAQKTPQYLIFESGTPDANNGPGPYITTDLNSLKHTFGEILSDAPRMYAYGRQQVFLTRSVSYIQSELDTMFSMAEQENIPLFIHIDPIYGWGADLENSTIDAPTIKYWNNETMREWFEFPSDDKHLPINIPRTWFNWGSWCSPVSAFPAIGAPDFLEFSSQQFLQAIVEPIVHWQMRLNQENKTYLFAGINIGWETHLFDYRGIDPAHLPNASWPINARNISMQQWEAGVQLGYASLYWQGWNEMKLVDEAQRRNITRDDLFHLLCYTNVHNYLEALARVCIDGGIPKDHVFTHIVAIASVNPASISPSIPPIWTAVNSYSIPGFTMDNRGAAIYNLTELKRQISAVDPLQNHFAVSESYLFNYKDEESMRDNLAEAFNNGASMKSIYGALPFSEDDPQPIGAIKAIRAWLNTKP